MLTFAVAVIAVAGCCAGIVASAAAGSQTRANEQSFDEVLRLVALRIARAVVLCVLALAAAIGTRMIPLHLALMTPHPAGALVARVVVLIATRAGWISA